MGTPKEMSISATIILISKDNKALILQRNPNDTFPSLWTVPGGKLKDQDFVYSKDENMSYYTGEYAAIREVKEETSIEVKNENLRFFCTMYMRQINRFVLSYYALLDKNSEEMNVVLSDNQDYRWISREEIKDFDFIPDIGGEISDTFELIKTRN